MRITIVQSIVIAAVVLGVVSIASPLAQADDLTLLNLQYTEHGNSTRMVLTANIPFMYDVRSAGSGTLLIEMDGADINQLAPTYNIGSDVIDNISLSTQGIGVDRTTEIIVKYNSNYDYTTAMQGRKLIVEFTRGAKGMQSRKVANTPVAEKDQVRPVTVNSGPARETSGSEVKAESQGGGDEPKAATGRDKVRFTLKDVRLLRAEGANTIVLDLDKPVKRADFKILPVGGPKRFVLDFHYAQNRAGTTALRGQSDYFTQVRIAQNRWDPHPVTRVVVDIENAAIKKDPGYDIQGSNVLIYFDEEPGNIAAAKEKPAQVKSVTTDQAKGTAEKPADSASAQKAKGQTPQQPVKKPARKEKIVESRLPEVQPVKRETTQAEPEAAAETPENKPDTTEQAVKQVEEPPVRESVEEQPDETAKATTKETTGDTQAVSTARELVKKEEPELKAQPVQRPREIPKEETASQDTMQADASMFDEAFPQEEEQARQDQPAAAMDDAQQQRDQRPLAGDPEFFQTREIAGETREYTGQVVDLEFESIPLSELILILGQLTDKNFIVDPSVSNIDVSIYMQNEPWDKALEVILDYHGLGKVEDGNLIRIATRAKLADEAEEKRNLREQQALAVPLRQVAKPINYANATELVQLLNSNLSQKGSVVVDNRTNTLVITDIPSKVDEHLNLIETLDIPTKQVYVEARIVETTRDFIHELGLQFGFNLSHNAATGNSTGLVFPNQVTISGNPNLGLNPLGGPPLGVNLPSPEASSSIGGSFSNISGSFVLDAILTAAESERKVRVLSRPRISAQNNMKAIIKSGVEVPFQVIQNNTVSIRFREATLKLEVTPHITSDSTVILDVLVDKSSLGVRTDAGFSIQTRQATSTIRVKDGGVAVIGGVLEINDSYTEERTPFLHKLPLVGNLFKAKLSRIQNTELIIFISPKIIG